MIVAFLTIEHIALVAIFISISVARGVFSLLPCLREVFAGSHVAGSVAVFVGLVMGQLVLVIIGRPAAGPVRANAPD